MHLLICYRVLTGEDFKEKGKLYKPAAKLGAEKPSTLEKLSSPKASAGERPDRPGKKKKEKKKSNLDIFKEELKMLVTNFQWIFLKKWNMSQV